MKNRLKLTSVLLSIGMALATFSPLAVYADNATTQDSVKEPVPITVNNNGSSEELSSSINMTTVDSGGAVVSNGSENELLGSSSSDEEQTPSDRRKITGEKIINIKLNGATFNESTLEYANISYTEDILPSRKSINVQYGDDSVTIYVIGYDSLYIPSIEKEGYSFGGYVAQDEISQECMDSENNTINFSYDNQTYDLAAIFTEQSKQESELLEEAKNYAEFSNYSLLSRIATTFGMNPYNSASGISTYSLHPYTGGTPTKQDLMFGVDYSKETVHSNQYTFVTPYDGEYTFTAYGANGGIGYGESKNLSPDLVGYGGKAAGTVYLKKGTNVYLYFGEAGMGGDSPVSDNAYYRNRTIGGGGGQISIGEAWYRPTDIGQYEHYHINGRGGGATYVTLTNYNLANAGMPKYDYTNAEHSRNLAIAQNVAPEIVVLAGGGGGAAEGSKGGNGGGAQGGTTGVGQYYAGVKRDGYYNYAGNYALVDSDRTDVLSGLVENQKLTETARIDAKTYAAKQDTAGFGLHYSIMGEAADRWYPSNNPKDKFPSDGAKRAWGSFYYGANAVACAGGGGGGWFGGGTDFGMGGGGGSSYAQVHNVYTNPSRNSMVTVVNPETSTGANAPVKYGGDYSGTLPANQVGGHITISLNAVDTKIDVNLLPASYDGRSAVHSYKTYSQLMVRTNKESEYENGNYAVFTADIRYLPSDGTMTVTPVWQYRQNYSSTFLDLWQDNRITYENIDMGVQPDGYRVLRSKLIIKVDDSWYNPLTNHGFNFRCKAIGSYAVYGGTESISDFSSEAELVIKWTAALQHNGVRRYAGTNIINGGFANSFADIYERTKGRGSSVYQYPNLDIINMYGKTAKAFVVEIGGDSRNTVDFNLSGYEGRIELLENQNISTGVKKRLFYAKNGLSEYEWEAFLQQRVWFTVYDWISTNGSYNSISGGAPVTWTAYQECGTALPDDIMVRKLSDGSTHYYGFVSWRDYLVSADPNYQMRGYGLLLARTNASIAAQDAKTRKLNGVAGHIVQTETQEEFAVVSMLSNSKAYVGNGMLIGAIPLEDYNKGSCKYFWATDVDKYNITNGGDSYFEPYVVAEQRHYDNGDNPYHEEYNWTTKDAYNTFITNANNNRWYGSAIGVPFAWCGCGFNLSHPGIGFIGAYDHGPSYAASGVSGTPSLKFNQSGPWSIVFAPTLISYYEPSAQFGDYYATDASLYGYVIEWENVPPSEPTGKICSDSDIIGTQEQNNPPATTPELGSASGILWVETDNDGIYEQSNDALISNVVAANMGFSVSIKNAFNGQTVKNATISENGNLNVSLPAGTYYAEANVGVFGANSKTGTGNSQNNTFTNGRSKNFTVEEGKSTTGINCGIYLPSTIEGYIYFDENNTGLKGNNQGISGVRVYLVDGNGTAIKNMVVGNDGHYSFSGLKQGIYTIRVESAARDISNFSVSKILPQAMNYPLINGGIGESQQTGYNHSTGHNKNTENTVAGQTLLDYVDMTVNVTGAGASNNGKLTVASTTPHYYRNCGMSNVISGVVVSGIVWQDLDGDGYFSSSTEQKLKGITVTLGDSEGHPISSVYDEFNVQNSTDSNGSFTLYCERGKSYTVLVSDRQILTGNVEGSLSGVHATKFVGGNGNSAIDFTNNDGSRYIVVAKVTANNDINTVNIGLIEKNELTAKFVNTTVNSEDRYGTNTFKAGEYGNLVITMNGTLNTLDVDYNSVLKSIQAAAVESGVFIDGNFNPSTFGPESVIDKTIPVDNGFAQVHSYELTIPINIPAQARDIATFTSGVSKQNGIVVGKFNNGETLTRTPDLNILEELNTGNDLFHTILH